MTTITQSEQEQSALHVIATQTGKTEAELVREAIAQFIQQVRLAHRQQCLQQARGIWRDRDDLPALDSLRRACDCQEL